MKLYLLAFLLCTLVACTPSFSQGKLEGIGRFKVGKTTIRLVQQIVMETGVPLKLVDANTKIDQLPKSQIVELKSSPNFGKPLPSSSHVRVFYLNDFQEEGIDLQSVYLYFANEVLVKLTCYATSKLNKDLEARYGQPEVNIVKLYSDCNVEAKSFILSWRNEIITATLSLLVSFDGDCQKRVRQEFSVAFTEKENPLGDSEVVAKGEANK